MSSSIVVGFDEDPEKSTTPPRRKFKTAKKLEILDEIDKNPDDIGLILRREGLYSSHLFRWRQWRKKMGNSPSKDVHNKLAKAERRILNLELKLKKAETIIDIQKKISKLMGLVNLPENQLDKE